MKLVDILARELKEWPEGLGDAVGQTSDGALHSENDVGHILRTDMAYTQCDNWIMGVVTRAQWQAAVDALKVDDAPAWNGEGYPPTGIFCEYQSTESGVWGRCEIIATRNNAWIVLGDDYDTDFVTLEALRPIITPEQAEAEERDGELRKMYDIACQPHAETLMASLRLLYDAGLRFEAKP